MRALVVLSPSISESVSDSDKHYLKIDDKKIPLALIHIDDTEFNKDDDKYANSVLVEKEGFSLNYRDLGIIENAWERLKKQGVDSYYPIGSDFSGKVINVGKNVTAISIGDRVIPDCAYPFTEVECPPGIPSNNASKELEVFHYGKLKKIPDNFPMEQAAAMSIGTQTSISMIEKCDIKENDNILITSVTSNTSLFILNFLKDKKCNVYGISYSGNKVDKVKKQFPFIKQVFNFKDGLPTELLFDSVIDPFSDTYSALLVNHLNYNCKYLTCGIFNQSIGKITSKSSQANISMLLGTLLSRNASIIGNCLGTSGDLQQGIDLLSNTKESNIIIDSVYTEDDDIGKFIDQSFSSNSNRFGKIVLKY